MIYPFLTSPFGLAWDPKDLISQSQIKVPTEITDSHIFRNGIPKVRKPDILISPIENKKNIVIIEEKDYQSNIDKLNNYRIQLAEHQALYECIWGVISDGEKWLIKRNLETFNQFNSLEELYRGVSDLRHCIGKEKVIKRLVEYGTTDLVIIIPTFGINQNILSFQSDISSFDFYFKIPVIVAGVESGEMTPVGKGAEEFSNLSEALRIYPDLDPDKNTKRFTWAMKETRAGNITRLRFETWAAYDLYSD
ncbi:hypothetical protein C7293_27400 [filamentous cyanobacterium CCT1]|nr:hypothetical protein C7293_27400 [filamentous cyanobacterium CCT1]PSN77035.1 hypothetical protein C8B47_24165 [filamentous cyanobacterium CCP4]